MGQLDDDSTPPRRAAIRRAAFAFFTGRSARLGVLSTSRRQACACQLGKKTRRSSPTRPERRGRKRKTPETRPRKRCEKPHRLAAPRIYLDGGTRRESPKPPVPVAGGTCGQQSADRGELPTATASASCGGLSGRGRLVWTWPRGRPPPGGLDMMEVGRAAWGHLTMSAPPANPHSLAPARSRGFFMRQRPAASGGSCCCHPRVARGCRTALPTC